ncbi:MAG: hypothetical protein SAJ72_15120 [Jaaginema sp. PMC 1080.18]|nr:hypothetical protein [Jaaginema sp. PMC 1080.18]
MKKYSFFNKIKRQLISPSRPSTVLLSDILHSLTKPFINKPIHKPSNYYFSDQPIAIYDLRCSPITYDFAMFLYEAECFFKSKNYDFFHVIIIPNLPGPDYLEPTWQETTGYNKIITETHQNQRIFNLLLPLASMYQACKSVNLIHEVNIIQSICSKNNKIFPSNYDGFFLRTLCYQKIYKYEKSKIFFFGLKAQSTDLDQIKKWLTFNEIQQPFVSFTIRNYQHQYKRNSNIEAYLKFSEYLENFGIASVFVPDTDNPWNDNLDFSQFPIFWAGTFNLYQRQALYEIALTNIFPSSGVAALCWLNHSCSFIHSGICNEAYPENTGMKLHKSRGQNYGDQPFCENRGIIEWGAESFDSLKKSFDILLTKNPNLLELKIMNK